MTKNMATIMQTHRMGEKGKIVIPKKIRKWLKIEQGDEITFLDIRRDRTDKTKISIRIVIPGR